MHPIYTQRAIFGLINVSADDATNEFCYFIEHLKVFLVI